FQQASAITRPSRRPAQWAAVAAAKCSISTLNSSKSTGGRGRMARLCRRKGEPNAQDQDQVGRQKALQDHRLREGALYAVPQAARHDQADQEADPPIAWHQYAVQDRRRQHQEVLAAQRLAVRAIP